MPGTMSSDQMEELASASGSAFDEMFLSMMIEHHEGAIEMAQTEQADGENPAPSTWPRPSRRRRPSRSRR